MRTVKFRGKDIFTGKWVYGDLVHNQKVTNTGLVPRVMVAGYEVLEDTIGLFTGLTDMNGKEIYEGDILSVKWCLYDKLTIVRFGEYKHVDSNECFPNGDVGFYMEHIGDNMHYIRNDILYFVRNHEGVEVIGNIHDNQVLIEK